MKLKALLRIWARPRFGDTWTFEFTDQADSKRKGFSFEIHVTLSCRSAAGVSRQQAVALAARRARQMIDPVAERFHVLRSSATEQEINYVLGRDFPGATEEMIFNSAHVAVSVVDAVSRAAELYEESVREMSRERLDRDRVRAELTFLRDDVFCDPATARLYWITKHGNLPVPGDFHEIMRSVGQWAPGSEWVVIAQCIQKFLEQFPRQNARDLVRMLERLFRENDRTDLAQELVRVLEQA
ncbi:hypothetical protein ONO23_06052 [Micromonospora noduli]|uniref:hypothetical protein n=1 Tax=Micromonospora noduli TaxID=709876 RepID=UPI000DBFB76F|nr:hypothetical protein [Micromonospora noduli]RAO24147.1 hypothetical protein ONO23_06052 [Micromonospora noduli]